MTTEKSMIRLSQLGFFALLVWLAGGLTFSSCKKTQDDQAQQPQDTQKVYQTTNNTTYVTEYQTYKTQSEHELARNQDTIATFQARLKKANAKIKASLDSTEQELERRNADLRAKLETFKAEGQGTWQQFKDAFDRSMDTVRTNLQDLNARMRKLKLED
jgi:chromatin segregation and condensation protein Rec8/ScpA/Scc1 (kleisin family)